MIADPDVGLARPDEARRIAEMSRDFIEHGLGWKWTPARILRCLADPATNVAVARERSGPIGFAIMEYKEDGAHPGLFAVGAAPPRKGLGFPLLDSFVKSARIATHTPLLPSSSTRDGLCAAFFAISA